MPKLQKVGLTNEQIKLFHMVAKDWLRRDHMGLFGDAERATLEAGVETLQRFIDLRDLQVLPASVGGGNFEYRGARHEHGAVVGYFDGSRMRKLPPRNKLRNHSPDGFEWGYQGSGPAQLALAIVCHALDVPDNAREPGMGSDLPATDPVVRVFRVYQTFKDRMIATLHAEHWTLTRTQVLAAIYEIEAEREAR